jgi:hypothetical protein
LERSAKRDGATRVLLTARLKGNSSNTQHTAHAPFMTQHYISLFDLNIWRTFLDYLTLQMKALRWFETSLAIYQCIRSNNPQDLSFHLAHTFYVLDVAQG